MPLVLQQECCRCASSTLRNKQTRGHGAQSFLAVLECAVVKDLVDCRGELRPLIQLVGCLVACGGFVLSTAIGNLAPAWIRGRRSTVAGRW